MTYQCRSTSVRGQRDLAWCVSLTSIGSGRLKLGFSFTVELIKVTGIFVILFLFLFMFNSTYMLTCLCLFVNIIVIYSLRICDIYYIAA